jgi:hypothetical protein
MAVKVFSNLEKFLAKYRALIGLLVLIMLITLSILTYFNFDKQNQIIETGGFIDGDIKCVCTQDAWDGFQKLDVNTDISNIIVTDG